MDAANRWMLGGHASLALDDLDVVDSILTAAQGELPTGWPAAMRAQLDVQRKKLQSFRDQTLPEEVLGREWNWLAQTLPLSQQAFRETLEVLGGALLRRGGYDRGICAVADTLVREILGRANGSADRQVHWDGMAMLGVGESYSHLGGTVRLRFPELNIWALPVVAHEAGHILIDEIRVWDQVRNKYKQPLLALTDTGDPDSSPDARLGELLADVLATQALGSAYACSALLLRFDPAQSDKPCRAHPATQSRAHVIVQTLRTLGDRYAWTADQLEEMWSAALTAAGKAGLEALNADARQSLDDFVDSATDKTRLNTKDLPYDGLTRAIALWDHLSEDRAVGLAADGAQIADVLTAAWRVRLGAAVAGRSLDLGGVSQRAAALCRSISLGAGHV